MVDRANDINWKITKEKLDSNKISIIAKTFINNATYSIHNQPVFNGINFFEEALKSVVQQSLIISK